MSVEVLIAAIEVMEEGKKWTGNINKGAKDCYCVYTALVEAHRQVTKHHCEYSAWPSGLERVMSAGQFSFRSDIFHWNDQAGRTWEEVKDLLERAVSQPFIPPGLHKQESVENEQRPEEDDSA